MERILAKWLVQAASILFAAFMFDGITVDGIGGALGAAAILGILNTFFRPFLLLFTLPVTIFSLGLFALVINAFLLKLTASMLGGFHVAGFGSAFFGSVVISLVNVALSGFRIQNGKVEFIDMRQDRDGRWR